MHEPDIAIPIPPKAEHGGRPQKYPYDRLAVGDSFFVPRTNLSTHHWKLRTGWSFTRRVVTEDGIRGSRVWRTE